MMKLFAGASILVVGLASTAQAEILFPSLSRNPALTQVAEGCGKGFWRGPAGHCHPFEGPGGPNRGTEFACPAGYHIGTIHDKCFPD
jgi:hypothetical protein